MSASLFGRAAFGAGAVIFGGLTNGVGLVPYVLWMGGMPKALYAGVARGLLGKRLQDFAEQLAEEKLQSGKILDDSQ